MPLLLSVDTSTSHASVALGDGIAPPGLRTCHAQKEQAAFVQPAIRELLQARGVKPSDLDAVAVTLGPGSYTGLRVGLASAKGLCYALQLPLRGIGTLEVMAAAARCRLQQQYPSVNEALLVPMIDARRMEVFTAVYTTDGTELVTPHALVLDATAYQALPPAPRTWFFGCGADKWQPHCTHTGAIFTPLDWNAADALPLARQRWEARQFDDVAYTAPLYVKAFQSGPSARS
ncbi:MAG TPA: tRNA (adenosine(37)-N6)-threonylcarbamoyltransferase complex dimerization subunit type 1 TsaB [Lacibacter sp.]|nr:tRNA (adenosine(37)-N6)-threonylcarbamoyltransferase complex dimerization subunit type 1 TsaB [Lacibacter sp.]